MGQIEQRLGEVAKLIRSDQDAVALRLHVERVLESPSFSSSRRSGQFLQYVVEKAIAQQIDALKERTIGIEIFHRSPDYDTGEDAVVRVTASDVRRRLAQHYSKEGQASDFKISLPPGGYVPEIFRNSAPVWTPPPVAIESEPSPVEALESKTPSGERKADQRVLEGHRPYRLTWKLAAFVATVLLALAAAVGAYRHRSMEQTNTTPWPLLFSAGKPLYVVLSDPDLNEIQLLTGRFVLLSDYANGKLGCESLEVSLRDVCASALRGDKVAAVDAVALSRLASLAAAYGSSIEPHPAREIRLTDLQSDRNVVFLGSRQANPWTDLFREKLDFHVAHDDVSGLQVVRDVHVRPGEAPLYIPTAGPSGTGESYTLITLVHNLAGKGYALLLTGATHEGTDEAAAIVADRQRFEVALRKCDRLKRTSEFQLLLRVKMMAGSPLTSEVITCHVL